MVLDLDKLKTEIPEEIQRRGLTLFHGISRMVDDTDVVYWDSDQRPEYRQFLDVAEQLKTLMVVMHSREFEEESVDDVIEQLEESEMAPSERRDVETRLQKLRIYGGFTCAIELSFDFNGKVYLYHVRSSFLNELLDIMAEIEEDVSMYEEPGENPGGGFYSRN